MNKKLSVLLLAAVLMISLCAAASASLYYVTGNNVRVRTGPGTDFDILSHLSRGTKIDVLSTSHGWARTANYYAIVNPTNNYVNMRWEASKTSQVRKVYYYGAKLKVIAENAYWCQVMDEATGEVGFMLKSLLLQGSATENPTNDKGENT